MILLLYEASITDNKIYYISLVYDYDNQERINNITAYLLQA